MVTENVRYLAPSDPQRQIAVFGADRLEELAASPEAAQPFVNAIQTLVAESEARDRALGIGHLVLFMDEDSPDGLTGGLVSEKPWTSASRTFGPHVGGYGEIELTIRINPDDEHGFGSSEMDRGIVSLSPLAVKNRSLRLKGLPRGRYIFKESLYVERDSGIPKLEGVLIATRRVLGRHDGVELYAVKDASESDVNRAMTLLTMTVLQEEKRQRQPLTGHDPEDPSN